MKKILLALLIPNLVFAGQRSEEIQNWVEVTPQKGYILSVDLHNEKMCSKIWTKQVKEFKKQNPHIKDPNVILVNQKIKVQDCRVQIKEVEQPVLEQVKAEAVEKPEWFVGAFGGLSMLGSRSDDTAKNGHNLGIKIGKKFKVDDKKISLAAGYLYNQSKTTDNNNSLGVYEVTTEMFLLEASLLSQMSEKFELGPKVMMVAGKDISLTEQQDSRAVGLYVGAEALYKLSKKVDLELNLQQRIDELSRVNALGNIGIRVSF
jgi:hypothetical protein